MRPLVVVSGAAGGIGSTVALRLARANFRVLAIDQDLPGLKRLQGADDNITIMPGDARSSSYIRDVRQRADELGGTHGLVGAIGTYPRQEIAGLTVDMFRDHLEVNLVAQYSLVRALCTGAPFPVKSIVFVGSVLARAGRHHLAGYISAKAGVEGLTRALAKELGPTGTRVNCVAPGSIAVDREMDVVPDVEAATQRQLRRQALGRRGRPIDVANVIAFLIHEDSSFVTGQTINVDGGWQLV